MDAAVTGPLAATLARLDAADDDVSYVAGDPGDGDGAGWCRLDQALQDGSVLDRWYRALLCGEAKGRPNVAGSLLTCYLIGTISKTVVRALTTEGRVWPITADLLAVRHRPDGLFDGIAVRTKRVRVLPGDPDVGDPDAEVVANDGALREIVADELVALAAPIFAAVRLQAPFGMPGMWGNFADGIAFWALCRGEPPIPVADSRARYATAAALIDAMAARVPLIRARPRMERVDWSGGTAWVPVKTACCLVYQTYDNRDEGFCPPCPLLDDNSRCAKWAERLGEQAMAADCGA